MLPGEDLTELLQPPAAPDSGFRQGVIRSFNASTGANTVEVAGALLTDLPLLSGSESLEYAPGNVVVLLRLRSSWAILGRVVTPGGVLAPSAIGTAYVAESSTNFALSTTWTAKTSGTFTVPVWANRVLVSAAASASVENTSAANDFANIRIDVGGVAGSSNYAAVTAAGTYPARYAHVGANWAREWTAVPGGTYTIAAEMKSTTGAWAADTDNIVSVHATATFRKV